MTPGTIPIADGVHSITDSLLSVAGSTINIGYAIAAMAGALHLAGNLAVNTNKFTVDASTGNTLVAGVLTASGGVNVTGTLNTTDNVTIFGHGSNLQYAIENTGTGGRRYFWGVTDNTSSYASAGTFIIVDDTASALRLSISSAGVVTIPGAFNVTGNVAVNTNKFTVDASTGNTLVAGTLTFSNLAGSGTRPVVASSAGVLSTSSGFVSGSAAAGQVAYWDASTNIRGTSNFLFTDTTGAGVATELQIINPNTGADSNAVLRLKPHGGTTHGDNKIILENGNGSTFRMIGTDTSDADKLKFHANQTFASTVAMTIDFDNSFIGIGPAMTSPARYLEVGYGGSGVNSRVDFGVTNPIASGANATAEIYVSCKTYAGIEINNNTAGSNWRIAVNGSGNKQLVIAQDSTTSLSNPVLRFTPTTFLGEFLSGNVSVTRSASAADVSLGVTNSNNASGTANAVINLTAGGTSGGDAKLSFLITGSTTWSMGTDNSDTQSFVISENAALGTSNRLKIAVGGAVTVPGSFTVSGTAAFSGGFTVSGGIATIGASAASFGLIRLDAAIAGSSSLTFRVASSSVWSLSRTTEAQSGADAGANLTINALDDSGFSIDSPIKFFRAAAGVIQLNRNLKFAVNNSTGAGAALLGANSPAGTLGAPYTWTQVVAADGTVCYVPMWT